MQYWTWQTFTRAYDLLGKNICPLVSYIDGNGLIFASYLEVQVVSPAHVIAWAPTLLDVLSNLVLGFEAVQVALAVEEAAPVILTVPTYMPPASVGMVMVRMVTPTVTSATVAQVTSLVTSSRAAIWKTQ